ncbi:MAG TPA: DUF948 domain-containing protein [Candidatus Acidoferrales bacterium]|jgi:hypothetical protein|nr:DUF948 domain-containing protein [Candidatus Acidoferrales bacterium]
MAPNGALVGILIVIAITFFLQMLIMGGMLMLLRKGTQESRQAIQEVEKKLDPIIFRVNRILENSEEKISNIVTDASEMTRLARGQAQKVDRVVSDALERTHAQVLRLDTIITGTLEAVEDAGVKVRRSVLGPLQQASAVLKGIRTGIDYIRGEHSSRGDAAPSPDEELFI